MQPEFGVLVRLIFFLKQVYGEATLIFPIVVGMSFYKFQKEREEARKKPGYIEGKPVH